MRVMGFSLSRDEQGFIWAQFSPEGRRPPLLTDDVLDSLYRMVEEAIQNPPSAVIFTGPEGGDFLVGVDLASMAALKNHREAFEASRRVQLLYQRIADLPCPTITAIEGKCIGGGTELALACSARLAIDAPSTMLALSEIHLGIIPGLGGTQRLPRLVGQQNALSMILTGQPVSVSKALEWGLIDRTADPGTLREEAARLAVDLIEGRPARLHPRPRLGPTDWFLERTRKGRKFVRERYRRVVQRKTRGNFPAPEKAIEAVEYSVEGGRLEEGLKKEAALLADLITGEVHPNLLHLLRCRQALRRPRGRDMEEGKSMDMAGDLKIPVQLGKALRSYIRGFPDTSESGLPAGTPPSLLLPGGYGILRRLPETLTPPVLEVAWITEAADTHVKETGSPPAFQDVARRLVSSSGASPVYCRKPVPSPGLSLISIYLREGDRLVAEGWDRDDVDDVLEQWGMIRGPFALSARLGDQWSRDPELLRWRWEERNEEAQEDNWAAGTANAEAGSRLIEEVVAALILDISRIWEVVEEPVEEGWLVLDVFVLGGPSFRGGVIGAARKLGIDRLRSRLQLLEQRWGELYRSDLLTTRGPLSEVGISE